MNRIQPGNLVKEFTLESADSRSVTIPDAKKLVHLQFRRFAGCPFCSLHVRTFVQRHFEIEAAGVSEVVVFRSSAKAIKRHHVDVPFAVVSDPKDRLYAEFEVGYGWRSLLSPRALVMAVPNVLRQLPRFPGIPRSLRETFSLPADFLIGVDGKVLACHYGKHADDQWSVDDVIALARQTS